MGSVFELNRKRVFSISEAREVLPIVRRVTEECHVKVQGALARLEAIREIDQIKAKELENQINCQVADWQTKIAKLGAEGKGLWLVDFDCGTGFYCWKFPEERLEHFHGYSEGFQGRVKMRLPEEPAVDQNLSCTEA
ncbi:unnamed protein product [Sphagnum balticum]